MSRLTNALRRYLNRRVIDHLQVDRATVGAEISRQRDWDGVPADLVARHSALTHALDLLEADYR